MNSPCLPYIFEGEQGGGIDAKTSPELEAEMLALTKEIKALDLDFSQVDYISSAGLRTLMVVQNELEDKGGSMISLMENCLLPKE